MKNLLLLLSALIFAVPAWAADEAAAPSATQASADSQPTQKTTKKARKHKKKKKAESKSSVTAAPAITCPTGCAVMHCPPPGGPYECCNTKTYSPC